MQATNQRAWHARLALMLILGVAAAAACVAMFMLWKAPAASAADETSPTDASFVVRCGFSHRAKVDPIVDFGGTADHMHDIFGNTTTKANSTYATLRAGGTTCSKPGDTAAYWIPKVSWKDSRRTTALTANQGLFYYRLADKDPNVDLPPHPALPIDKPVDGLKVVTVQGSNVEWRCAFGTWSTSPPTQCNNGKLIVRIKFPDCLKVDANRQPLLDSADHRLHMVHADLQANGVRQCPPTHPYAVPRLQMNIQFPIPTTRGNVKLSSGDYTTMHADFFNAWDQPKLADLVNRCINAGPFTASNQKPPDCL
jgi:hypothetical protein